MSLSILNNIPSLAAENQINITNAELQKALQLSSGERINSGADDAAGLAIADGLNANVAALTPVLPECHRRRERPVCDLQRAVEQYYVRRHR